MYYHGPTKLALSLEKSHIQKSELLYQQAPEKLLIVTTDLLEGGVYVQDWHTG